MLDSSMDRLDFRFSFVGSSMSVDGLFCSLSPRSFSRKASNRNKNAEEQNLQLGMT